MIPDFVGVIIDKEHSALAEQIGVQRLYYVDELSSAEDVFSASIRALARISEAISDVHNHFGGEHVPIDETTVITKARLNSVSVLLETDIDPEAAVRWGWTDE
jgi:hypothetical protein